MYNVKSKWSLIIPIAIFIQLAYIYKQPDQLQDPDIDSAVRRAKTESCKKELKDFGLKVTNNVEELFQQHLKRTCKLDLDNHRVKRVGCIKNSTSDLTKLEEQVTNSSLCSELCFSYGHSYGGFHLLTKNCFCGDFKFVVEDHKHDCSDQDELDWFKVNVGIYNPSNENNLPPNGIEESNKIPIRIAFLLILSGRSTLHIKRILKNIYSEKHFYYIHIDERDNYLFNELLYLEKNHKNIVIAKSRFNTIWGGPSLLRMIIDAMKHLSLYNWDYLINLSESDFPIKPLEELDTYLQSSAKLIYLKAHNIKGYNFIKKQGLDRNFYQCEDRVWRIGKRLLPRGIIYSGGSDWFALPRDFCNYILNNLSNQNSLVRPLVQLYNYTLLPAESFFHTLALNSEFCDRFANFNLRITNWHRKQGCKCQHKDVVDWCGCSPLIYRLSDWPALLKTNLSNSLFFSRKFDPTISSSVINAVEQQLVLREPTFEEAKHLNLAHWQSIFETNNSSRLNYSYLKQIGCFALNQAKKAFHLKEEFTSNIELISVHTYFDEDRFKGLIFNYCDKMKCLELLMDKNISAHLNNKSYDFNCINIKERQLNFIEVNHGFDTGERMFRDYLPLNKLSDVAVYHEWVVNSSSKLSRKSDKVTNRLFFSWFNPHGQLELMQNVKLKSAQKPVRLSLAHRLNVRKPLSSGLWTLTISHHNGNCLNYRFLVFDETSFLDNTINQKQFDEFYNISNFCVSVMNNKPKNVEENLNNCSEQSWSLLARKHFM